MIKTRFAPSPTGHLHIGSARTALYAWLLAKHHGGQCLLRIEDTDLERSKAEYTASILEAMTWLGLDTDGEAPVHQTQRMERYKEVLRELEAKGKVYRCTCTKERLADLRADQMACQAKPRYDGRCRDLGIVDDDQPYVLRFRTPESGAVTFKDAVHGEVSVNNEELDDLVVARSDGTPTYNLTVVIDDADMGITHVVRGDDHLSNTPRQIHLYEAMGWDIPQFCHVPMILGPDGKRLSKRHGAVSVMAYQEGGYLPDALLNYLVRLGWSHGDQEVFTRDALIKLFDLSHLSRSSGMFNLEKLQWVNQEHLKASAPEALAPLLADQLASLGVDVQQADGPALRDVVALLQPRAKTLREMAQMSVFWYQDAVVFDPASVAKYWVAENGVILQSVMDALSALTDWAPEVISAAIKGVVADHGVKFPKVAQPLRVALTGGTVSPAIDQTVFLLGKDRCLARLVDAIQKIA